MRFRETSRGEFLGYRRTEKGLHSGEGCEILSRQNTIKRKEAKRFTERANDFYQTARTCVGMFSSLSTLSILSHHGQRRWCRESARAR